MFSIENFYYIIHQHLLKPLNLQDTVYVKFGSTYPQDIVRGFYSQNSSFYGRPKAQVHSCYFYDQEPIKSKCVDDLLWFTTINHCKILANSEISAEKTHSIKEHNLIDWYYFFHGFAALDWYRNARYFKNHTSWDRAYLSLNRLHVNDRSYRLNLVARLQKQQLLSQGHVSLHLDHAQYGSWQQELDNPHSRLSEDAKQIIAQHLDRPLWLDHVNTTGDLSAVFGHKEFELWLSGWWHVVTETVFYHDKLHLTEKIFKPIVARRPFLLVAAPGNLAYIKSYGFKTFDQWIDESYDTIKDPDQRIQAIVDQIQKLCTLSPQHQLQMHKDMQSVLEHNFNHFYGEFKHICVTELLNNFQGALAQWNNGRVDDRDIAVKLDFELVKQILLS